MFCVSLSILPNMSYEAKKAWFGFWKTVTNIYNYLMKNNIILSFVNFLDLFN